MEQLRERQDISEEFTWSLEAMFATDDAWEAEFAAFCAAIEQDPFNSIRGHSHEGADTLLRYFVQVIELEERLGKLAIYAHTKNDQDTRVTKYQAMMSRVKTVEAEYGEMVSFFEPELLSLPQDLLDQYIADEKLADFRKVLANIVRNKPHVLSNEVEAVLASLEDVLSSNEQVFAQLTNADFVHGSFTVDETEYLVTEGRFGLLLRHPDRRVRQSAYERLYDTYLAHKNSISALYAASVKKSVRLAQTRKFQTARERALFSNQIPVGVYDALVAGVRGSIGHVHRYIDLRKRHLGLDAVRLYDKYVPLVEAELETVEFEEGFSLVLQGLKGLGPDYASILKTAREQRWLDVYENPGKRSGAYSTGFYATRPYVLLNYQGNYDSVSTLAHELGHSVHTYLSGKHQPPQYSGYSIFLAEIASTVNETLLMNHLLDTTADPLKRATLINHQLDTLTSTIYRQTMFAEFEHMTHRHVEAGNALTHDGLSEMYAELNQFYHGPAYADDERSPAEWSRIPHFYRDFYVYQYATGMSAALVFADRIRKEGDSAAAKYLGFLKSGSKDYPLEVLLEAGLDMNDPDVVAQALQTYAGLVEELENLLENM